MAKRKFWSSDKIVAFVAMGISLITLVIFVKQTNIIEEQSHLSVMPYLMMETSDNGFEKRFRIDVINYGVGPAIIEERTLRYKGEVYDMEFADFLEQFETEMDSIKITNRSTLQEGLAITAGSERNILGIGGGETSYNSFLQLMQGLISDSLYYEIKYRSIYGDRWRITSQNESPEKLD